MSWNSNKGSNIVWDNCGSGSCNNPNSNDTRNKESDGRMPGYNGSRTRADLNNRANQLNPNNRAYAGSRRFWGNNNNAVYSEECIQQQRNAGNLGNKSYSRF